MVLIYLFLNLGCLFVLGFSAIEDLYRPTAYIPVAVNIGLCTGSLIGLVFEVRRPGPLVENPGDCVMAAYMPPDHPCGGEEDRLIGKTMIWKAVWRIDAGKDKGDWAMSPQKEAPDTTVAVPLKSLVVQERRKALLFRKA